MIDEFIAEEVADLIEITDDLAELKKLQIERTINMLMESKGIKAPKAAREFLRKLAAYPVEMRKVSVPIACQLLRTRGWRSRVTVNAIVEYCEPRLPMIAVLRLFRTDEVDAEITFMVGMLDDLREKLWRNRFDSMEVTAETSDDELDRFLFDDGETVSDD